MIRIENLHVRVGAFRLEGVTFEVPTSRYAVLMGKSGSGKTTILETLCGLNHAVSGRILLMGEDVTRLSPAVRGVGYVPQDGALFSTMTVRENLAFALRIRWAPEAEIAKRVDELAGRLGIEHLLDRRPQGLSGGEVQRVALGRALSYFPKILCLDEPLSALDEETREEMYGLLKSIQQYAGVTTLHVTHNLGEANRLADLVFVLKDGRVSAVR